MPIWLALALGAAFVALWTKKAVVDDTSGVYKGWNYVVQFGEGSAGAGWYYGVQKGADSQPIVGGPFSDKMAAERAAMAKIDELTGASPTSPSSGPPTAPVPVRRERLPWLVGG